jgi:hypothetical protein
LSSITIFNLTPIERFDPNEIRAAVTESNFYTLCNQYGLDPSLIRPASAYLKIQAAPQAKAPFFTLHYAPEPAAPIVVNCWNDTARISSFIRMYSSIAPDTVRKQLALSREVFSVELTRPQSNDMGLLFAYELARWIAVKGNGVVYALDGEWYRMNPHKAFLPISR